MGEFQIFNKIDQAEANGLIQTEEGALTETHSMLQRMTTLATQAANGTYSTSDEGKTARESIQKEVDELADEITRIAQNTKYNGLSPLDGSNKASGVTYTPQNTATAGSVSLNTSDGSTVTNAADTSYVIKTASDGTKTVAGTYTVNDAKNAAQENADKLNSSNQTTGVSYLAVTQKEITASGSQYSSLTSDSNYHADTNAAFVVKATVSGGTTSYSIEANSEIKTDDLASSAATSMSNAGEAIQLQVGPTSGETLTVNQTDMTFAGLFGTSNPTGGQGGAVAKAGLSTDVNQTATGAKVLDMSSVANANKAIDSIKTAINSVSSYRADLGAKQNRLEHTINNLKTTNENVTAAESRIRDTDMAKEIAAYTKNNILSQAAQSMLAQANQSGQGVLTLLRG